LRASEGNELPDAAINEAISRKPKRHDFIIHWRSNFTLLHAGCCALLHTLRTRRLPTH
jgi:hypothetical protein